MASRYTQIAPVTFGAGALATLGDAVKGFGAKKVMVVSDPGVVASGITARAVSILEDAGIEAVVFDGVEMDAPDYTITKGAELAVKEGVQLVVGVGGGSSLDSAKAIGLLATNLAQGATVYDIIRFNPAAPFKANPALPNVMVPTTSGTGSEVTFIAVVGDTEQHVKRGCIVFPGAAIVDPELTLGLAPAVTAYTGMDAFSHASEALASVGINPHSDLLALSAIERIINYLPVAIADPMNLKAREELAIASNFAGKAFQDSTVNVGHTIAHVIGAAHHIPHGVGCALATPVVEEKVASSRPEIFAKIACWLGADVAADDPQLGTKLADALRAFEKKIGIPSLKDQGLTREQCMALVPAVIADGMRRACSVALSEDDLADMMAKLYDLYQ